MKPTEIDLARAEFYKLHPEAIISIGEWDYVYTCKICGGLLSPNMAYMFQTIDGKNYGLGGKQDYHIPPSRVSCPYCFNSKIKNYWISWNSVSDSDPIDTVMYRRRKIVIAEAITPGWWARMKGAKPKAEQFFYEYHPDTIEPLNETKGKLKR